MVSIFSTSTKTAKLAPCQRPDVYHLLLLHQVVQKPVRGGRVGVDVHLAPIVKEVRAEVIYPALPQLLFKDLPFILGAFACLLYGYITASKIKNMGVQRRLPIRRSKNTLLEYLKIQNEYFTFLNSRLRM